MNALSQSSFMMIAGPLLAVLVVTVALLGVLAWYRRRMREEDLESPEDFTLGSLRALHKEGKLSTEEFERAKARVVALSQAKKAAPSEPPVEPKLNQDR
jgi:hypothetical protein